MADVFISYKSEERPAAERLAKALQELGFDVWFDFKLLSGEKYRDVIREVINKCAAAVVLWSTEAITSDFVMDEAGYAKKQGKLCPARIDGVELPLGFGQIQTADLREWNGESTHSGFANLLEALEAKTGKKALPSQRSPAGEGENSADLKAFKAAQIAATPNSFRSYLRQFPAGVFVDFVRGQLQEITEREAADDKNNTVASAPPRASGATSWLKQQVAINPWRLIAVVLVIAVVGGAASFTILGAILDKDNATAESTADVDTTVETLDAVQSGGASLPPGIAVQGATASADAISPAESDLARLHPDVRRAVETAYAAAARAGDAATRGAEAATKCEEAARRALNGEAGYLESPHKQYAGQWSTGFHGYGLFRFKNGNHYCGHWHKGYPSGVGAYRFDRSATKNSDALSYEGEYVDGKRNGVGVFRWRSGARYAGSYRDNLKIGVGVLVWPGGSYAGEFENDVRDGFGVEWDASGAVVRAGIWTNDKLTTSLTP